MAEWHASFEGILALHQSGFLAALQKTCRTIVRTVRDNISAQNNSKDELIELPKALKKAEEEFLRDEPDNLSPEEREAAAFYKKEISDWDVVQKLFKQEMDQYNKDEQEKPGVKNEIKRLRMYGKSGIEKVLLQNHKQFVILANHKKTTDQTLSVIIVLEEISSGPQKVLKNLQNGQSWNFEPSDLEENDNESDEEDEDEGKGSLPELILDNQGYAKLPSCTGVSSKGQQELVCQIFCASYSAPAAEPNLKEQKEWPAWATWSWKGSYLPSDLHTVEGKVPKFLQIAESAKISGFSSGMQVTLGLGLLLREYAVNKVRSGIKHLLKAKHVGQENAIIDNIVVEEGSGAVDHMDTTADREEGGNEEMLRQKLADELKKKEELNHRHEELKQQVEAKELHLNEAQQENSCLEKERGGE
ncbi:hypothetical protein BDR04DRAFT_1112558 [Suillus decipiens]|nr:hypothetical protein BDR04DRAFT_1112558 [Suillus decipiens]